MNTESANVKSTDAAAVNCGAYVEFGRRMLRADELSALAEGDVVELDAFADDYVQVHAGGRLVARGRAVVVDGKLAVRIQEALT